MSSDARDGDSVDELAASVYGDDSAFHEIDLLDRMDSYWDDIEGGVIVSRMVSDSVVKGMVSAVSEEAAERITLMETEIAFLKERLRYYEPDADVEQNLVSHCGDDDLFDNLPRGDGAKDHIINEGTSASEVKLSAHYEHIKEITSRLMMSSVKVQQLEQEIQNLIKGLQDEIETLLSQNKHLVKDVNKKCKEKVGDLRSLSQELDALSKALLSSELGMHVSRTSSHENLKECNTVKSKDHVGRKVSGNHLSSSPPKEEECIMKPEESSKPVLTETLMRMTREELILYFKNEMTKMKRQHDSVLQGKTEELFSLKREFLKEKGYSPFHFKRDKEFDMLMKKIPEFISKLGDIRLESEGFPVIHNDQTMLCSLKEKIEALFFENQQLHSFLKDNLEEVRAYASQISDVQSQLSCRSSKEETFVKQIMKLQSDMEDVEIEADLKDQIINLVLVEAITEFRTDMEDLEMAAKIEQDIYLMQYREAARDALSSINPMIAESQQQLNFIASSLTEKEKALSSELKEKMILRQEIDSLSALVEEKENFASDTASALAKEKEHLGVVCQELSILKKQVNEQERLNSESKRQSYTMQGRLDEAMQQIRQYEVRMSELNQNIISATNALEEEKKQNIILAGNIQEKQNTLESVIRREEEQEKQMAMIISSMSKFSNAIVDSESRLVEHIRTNESRLGLMKHQCVHLVQQGNLLKSKELWYKQRLERQCSDLQKAEREVDLLGDDVDALLSLLRKIHLALDHYSPILQHYPGVVEVLKLIKKGIKGKVVK